MLLDFKGPLLDSATSPFAAQVWARGKVGVSKALSWDRRHARHNTHALLFSNRWIYLFVFSYSHRYQVGRDPPPPPPQRVNASPRAPHTRGNFPLKEIKDAIRSAKNKDQLVVAGLAH